MQHGGREGYSTNTAKLGILYQAVKNKFLNEGELYSQASINTVLICGIFRAGGDSKFGFVADTINMWCVSVPLGLLAAFVFKLPPLWVYFVLFLDEFEKMPFVIRHYFKKGWLRNITRDMNS